MPDKHKDSLPPTRAGAVAADLRLRIQTGEIPPGSRLRQAEIAERYGVSTTPVREAFVTLAREGLVRQDAHRGVISFAPSVAELSEIYEIRTALEPMATRIAASQITSATLDELDKIVARMRRAKGPDYSALNSELHTKIYSAADRPRLLDIIENLRRAASGYLMVAINKYDEPYAGAVQAEHEAIVESLRNGTPAKAARLMRQHLENSAREVTSLLAKD